MLLRLIGGEEVLLTERELWLGLRHRDTLFFFAGVVAFLMVLDVRGEGRNYALWQCALFFAASQLLAVVSVSIVLSLLRSLHRTPDPLRLHLTPFAMMAAAFMTLTCELSVYLAGGRVLDSALELAMLWFLFYALGELQAIMLLTMIAPRVLDDLRGRGISTAEAEPPEAEATDAVMVGDLRIDPATIRHVRAEGNYVDIRTDSARHYLLATFATVVAALGPEHGRQIHRSHWVAARVLQGFYRDGRDLVVRLEDGSEIRVAQSRQKDLLPWLESVTGRIKPETPPV